MLRKPQLILTFSLLAVGSIPVGCSSTAPRQIATPEERSQAQIDRAREMAVQTLLGLADHVQPVVRANTIEAFAAAPEAGTDAIEAGLRDSNEGVRSVAAVVVGRLGLESAAGWLRPLVMDESEFVRVSAVFALRKLGEDIDLTPLANTLFTSHDTRARAHTAFLLGELGSPTAIDMLRQASLEGVSRASASEVALLRLQIAEAMIKLGDDGPLPGVKAALFPARPEEFELAALAIQIIGEVGDRNAVDQLIYLADAEGTEAMPPEIRLAAADALSKLGHPQGAFIADEYRSDEAESVRAYAAVVYGRTDAAGNLGKVLGMLSDRSPIVRAAAARAVLDLTGTND
ncbi:MAG: HEAT repeat protein [Phycisphaerales bacterium]|jgi:HEAT repeat protein